MHSFTIGRMASVSHSSVLSILLPLSFPLFSSSQFFFLCIDLCACASKYGSQRSTLAVSPVLLFSLTRLADQWVSGIYLLQHSCPYPLGVCLYTFKKSFYWIGPLIILCIIKYTDYHDTLLPSPSPKFLPLCFGDSLSLKRIVCVTMDLELSIQA